MSEPKFALEARVRGNKYWLPAVGGEVVALKPSSVEGFVCSVMWDGWRTPDDVNEAFLDPP